MLLLELEVFLVERVDAVDHGLDQLDLGVAEAVLVGNVVGHAVVAAGLAAGASRLDLQLLAPGLQGGEALLGPAGQVDVDRGAHARAEIRRAGVQVAVLFVEQKLFAGLAAHRVPDGLDASSKATENATDVAAYSRNTKQKIGME